MHYGPFFATRNTREFQNTPNIHSSSFFQTQDNMPDLDLPTGCRWHQTEKGEVFFINDLARTTSWTHPRVEQQLVQEKVVYGNCSLLNCSSFYSERGLTWLFTLFSCLHWIVNAKLSQSIMSNIDPKQHIRNKFQLILELVHNRVHVIYIDNDQLQIVSNIEVSQIMPSSPHSSPFMKK